MAKRTLLPYILDSAQNLSTRIARIPCRVRCERIPRRKMERIRDIRLFAL